jgi:hypothetical protein
MESVEQYRQFAEECRRLAEGAPPKEKVALLEMAGAWDQCAKEAAESRKTVDDAPGVGDDPQAPNG